MRHPYGEWKTDVLLAVFLVALAVLVLLGWMG